MTYLLQYWVGSNNVATFEQDYDNYQEAIKDVCGYLTTANPEECIIAKIWKGNKLVFRCDF